MRSLRVRPVLAAVSCSLVVVAGCSPPDAPAADPAPSIASVAPSVGPMAGGTRVVIKGAGFANGAAVNFGATAATGVTWVSATELSAITPSSPSGFATVTVRNPGGLEGAAVDGFYFNPPILVLSNSSCPAAGGCLISVVAMGGYSFVLPVRVFFGAVEGTVRSSPAPTTTSFLADVPPGAPGTVNVTVVNGDSTNYPATAAFTYN